MTQKTSVDWLRFRTQADVIPGLEALRSLYGPQAGALNLHHLPRGKDGFQRGAEVRLADLSIGRVDFGGESQRGWVRWNITGQGCEWVTDWDAIEEVEALPAAELRRVDVALTTWQGEVTHEQVVAAHEAGRFTCGGRPPNMRLILNSDTRRGRTCEVGKRGSDKFLRAYEKGFELAGKWAALNLTHIDGFAIEDIFRCEVELQAETRPVPWEVVPRRDQYFAGSYPFCADILPGVEADILTRRPERSPQYELAAMLEQVRTQFGKALYTAMVARHGDFGAVWERIVGREHHQGLVQAGVLLVDHDGEGAHALN